MADTDAGAPGTPPLRIATLNIRNTSDRWRQRRHLALAQLAEMRCDVIALQELRRWPSQARWITRRLNQRLGDQPSYLCHATGKTGLAGLWEGIALLTRLPVLERGHLDLGGEHRVASWVRVRLTGSTILDIHNAHLASGDAALRDRQARLILDHMAARPGVATVLVGDLNAGPTSFTLDLLGETLRSAYTAVHGQEPVRTWPTPLRSGAGAGRVIDYVLVDDDVEVLDAKLAFDQPSYGDPALFASDHFGIAATVTVRPH